MAGLSLHLGVLSRRLSLRPSLGSLSVWGRGYGAAAAAYDYDYCDWDEDESELRVRAMADSEGSKLGRGVQWVVIGEPGAKKHVYAQWLSKLLDVPHISLGNLVRQELSPHSSLYKQIESSVNLGKLVPEDIIFGLLTKRLEEGCSRGENGFILEGIPRTRMQAEILDQIAEVDLALNFKCADNCMMHKHLGNGINFQFHGCQVQASSFDRTAWREKLRAYAEQSKPMEDYYRKQKKLLEFKVAEAPAESWQGLLAALQLQHLNSSAHLPKLTA
ncbi:hypothetical protein V2J09_010900 [Rumex salicifolius]